MLTRQFQFPQDIPALTALDTSFTTDKIYQPILDAFSFSLKPESVSPPIHKVYELQPDDPDERKLWDHALISEEDGVVIGFVAAQYTSWNRRVILWHLYVAPEFRGCGVGTKLLEVIDTYARSVEARCIWLETQNTNFPAIEFYLRSGFRFCGFDDSLYHPTSLKHDETALFFVRPLDLP